MRHTYGIVDGKKILTLKPQLYHRSDDLLVFSTRDFNKWYGDVKEYIDGIFQINSKTILEKDKPINITDIDMAVGLLTHINHELENIFNSEQISDLSYQYLSTLNEKYKKRRANSYTSDTRRCDIKIPVKPEITPWLKNKHTLEIVDEAWRLFNWYHNKNLKKQNKLADFDQ